MWGGVCDSGNNCNEYNDEILIGMILITICFDCFLIFVKKNSIVFVEFEIGMKEKQLRI